MDQHTDPQYKTDDGSALRIWKDAAQNNFLTQREGRPIFDEVTYIEVISPGSGNSTPIFEAIRVLAPEAKADKPKYGMKYDEYKKYILDFEASENHDASLTGTPLSQWAEMTRTMVASLKVGKIFTVDALAALPDSKLTVVGPDGRTWREKAKAYIENAKSNAYATEIAAQLERQKADNAMLQDQIKALAAQVEALQSGESTATGGDVRKEAKTPPSKTKPEMPPPLDTGKLQSII